MNKKINKNKQKENIIDQGVQIIKRAVQKGTLTEKRVLVLHHTLPKDNQQLKHPNSESHKTTFFFCLRSKKGILRMEKCRRKTVQFAATLKTIQMLHIM